MDIEEIIGWLEEEWDFSEVKFVKEKGENLYFTAFDEDDSLVDLEFEPDHDKVIASVKYPNSKKWTILEVLLPGF